MQYKRSLIYSYYYTEINCNLIYDNYERSVLAHRIMFKNSIITLTVDPYVFGIFTFIFS